MSDLRWWRRVEFGDSLMFFYIAVIMRQYFWWSGAPNAVAWQFAFILGALGTWLYVRTREFPMQSVGLPFWLLVTLPLAFVYAIRVASPTRRSMC
jgi:uncharacterized protein YybS (DUF2232 family)